MPLSNHGVEYFGKVQISYMDLIDMRDAQHDIRYELEQNNPSVNNLNDALGSASSFLSVFFRAAGAFSLASNAIGFFLDLTTAEQENYYSIVSTGYNGLANISKTYKEHYRTYSMIEIEVPFFEHAKDGEIIRVAQGYPRVTAVLSENGWIPM
ncbi:hypothetical protein [Alkalibacillus haloalkaliphilus]|uniref:hypothetical protein n=1 Tax=Alkalibacillus haloalkaliphilus TaxID=94136 RepID=UPI002936985E|nr:hypothetical protein [Alkalibacillus haloalkaliphilus]MDV2583472.1 hypothetical protein [Alkalibacillus haloalkaliphilus]